MPKVRFPYKRNKAAQLADRKEAKALKDLEIVSRPICESMKKHGLSFPRMSRVRKTIMERLRKSGDGKAYLRKVREGEVLEHCLKTLRNAEEAHPGILKDLQGPERTSTIARKYDLSRQRVSEIRRRYDAFKAVKSGEHVAIGFQVPRLPNL